MTLLASSALPLLLAAAAPAVPTPPVTQATQPTVVQTPLPPRPPKVAPPHRVGHAMPNPATTRIARANREATRGPLAVGFINAVQVYPFTEGAIYQAWTAPGIVTDIALEAGETLIAVASGDTVRWTIGDTTSGSGATKRTHILVKPFSAGLATNLIVTTDRRLYHVQLTSTGRTAMAALSWTYPADALLALKASAAQAEAAAPVASGLSIERLWFGYTVSGDKPAWRPIRAFDNGRQTFIEFPADIASGEAPPLFVVGERGAAELVNYRMRGRYYVVDRLFDVAELRLGTKRQEVVRIDRDGTSKRKHRR